MTRGLNRLRGSIPKTNEYDNKFHAITIDPRKFNALIAQYGIRLLHEKAIPCPNYIGALSSQQHDTNCPLCENSMIHFDGKELIGYFSTNEMVRNFLRGGFWESGSALLTVPSYYANNPDDQVYISFYDRFTMLDFEDRMYEVIHKSEGNVDKLKFNALRVEYLRTKSNSYTMNRHFEIDADGNIKWLTNERPGKDLNNDLGELFSISYYHRPVYRVVNMLHEGRFSQNTAHRNERTPMRFPQQMLVKKDFIIEKRDENGNVIPESVIP